VCNFSPVHRQNYRLGVPAAGQYERVFSSDDAAFGGAGLGDRTPLRTEYSESHGQPQSLLLDLPPMSAVIYRCVRKFPPRRKSAPAADKPAKPGAKGKPKAKTD